MSWLDLTFAGLAFFLILLGICRFMAQRIDRHAVTQCPPQVPLQKLGSIQWHAVRMEPAVENTSTAPSERITVLMVHGIGGNLRHFQMNMQADLTKTHTVIAIDRPGSGYSTCARALSLLEQAQALHAWLDQHDVGRVLIVGHSLGGAIALAMAQQRPERVAGLSLIAPFTAAITKPPTVFLPLALIPHQLFGLFAYTLLPVMAQALQRLNLQFVFSPVPTPNCFTTQGGGDLSKRPSQLLALMHDMRHAKRDIQCIQAQCQHMTLPVQVLYDRADRVLEAQLHGAQLPTRLPKAQVSLIDNGGHMLPITQSTYCVNWVRQQLHCIESTPHAHLD